MELHLQPAQGHHPKADETEGHGQEAHWSLPAPREEEVLGSATKGSRSGSKIYHKQRISVSGANANMIINTPSIYSAAISARARPEPTDTTAS